MVASYQRPTPTAGVDIRVSYTARVVACVAVGGAVLLACLAVLVADWIGASARTKPEPAVAPAAPLPCEQLTGSARCRGQTEKGGVTYVWRVVEPGTYRIAVTEATSTRTLEILKQDFKSIEFNAGKPGPDTVSTVTMSPGEYRVRISELFPKPENVGKPFTLAIEKSGAPGAVPTSPPPSPAAGPTPASAGLIAFGALGLLFVGAPLFFLPEKKRIPLRIDPVGVTMRDERRHVWNQYRGMRVLTMRTRTQQVVETGVELQFTSGFALLRYRPITNLAAVMPIVNALKQGRNPWV